MGYSTREIPNDEITWNFTKQMEVTEASKIEYFSNNAWKDLVIRIEERDNDNSFYFTLCNGDFVRMEVKSKCIAK
jgi:hypothetical protein